MKKRSCNGRKVHSASCGLSADHRKDPPLFGKEEGLTAISLQVSFH